MSKADSKADANTGYEVNFSTDAKAFSAMDGGEKMVFIAKILLKVSIVILALYFFICSLSFLADGFRLVAGRQAGLVFRNSEVFNNPIAGMLVGVLVTVLVQSSSTSTSIVITMVAADLLTVRQAISLIMGANIGTSVTSTIVALAQSVDRDEFRRAFAAATVHDMFNFLNVLVLLPLEAMTGYLYHFSAALIPASLQSAEKPPDILKVLTKPFTKSIGSLDKKVITKIAAAETDADLAKLDDARLLKYYFGCDVKAGCEMADGGMGILVLIVALLILTTMLFTVVYTLKSLLKGQIALWLHKSVNGNVPDIKLGGTTIPMQWVAGYMAMGVGLLVTIAVQSSSITTSTITPLVGVGVISVERVVPVVLGANIGTCVTGVLAALAADSSKLYLTLQVAFSHLLFNITGIVIWYVIWPMRAIPVGASKFLGNTTAKYKWFPIAYLVVCFFLGPLIVMGISLGSNAAAATIVIIFFLVCLFVCFINWMQGAHKDKLPAGLQSWDWLPVWMRSLEPMDRAICGPMAKMCCKAPTTTPTVNKEPSGEATTASAV
jgi:sodium-dependent phosphate cotransporter